MNKTLLVASVLALSGLTSVATAADNSWFVRGEVGQSRVSVNGFTGSNSDTAAGVRGGYFFNPNFAVEGFYTNYGTRSDGFGDDIKIDGWGLGIVGKKNFGPNDTGFFIDGRLGAALNHTRVSIPGFRTSDNSTKPYAGLGAGYDFNRSFGLSVNYNYTQANAFGFNGHLNTWTGALEARF